MREDEQGWKQPGHSSRQLAQNPSPPEPGNPSHAEICVTPAQKSRNKGDTGTRSGRDIGAALRLLARRCRCDPDSSRVPGTCGSITPGMGERGERTASAGRPPLPAEVHSQLDRPGGDAGKLDIIYPGILKAYSKHLCIRLFRNRRHYREIRNSLGDRKSRVGINI